MQCHRRYLLPLRAPYPIFGSRSYIEATNTKWFLSISTLFRYLMTTGQSHGAQPHSSQDLRWKLKRIRVDGVWIGQRTRLAALTALALSIVSSFLSLWIVYALMTNVAALKNYKAIPEIGDRFDAVASAAAVGRLDVLTIVLAIGAIMSAVGLVFSYTAFKAHAIASAIEEVQRSLPGALREHLGEHGEQLVKAALRDAELVAHINRRFTELGLDDTEDAFTVDDDPNWKEEPQ